MVYEHIIKNEAPIGGWKFALEVNGSAVWLTGADAKDLHNNVMIYGKAHGLQYPSVIQIEDWICRRNGLIGCKQSLSGGKSWTGSLFDNGNVQRTVRKQNNKISRGCSSCG